MDERWSRARNILVVRLDNIGDVLLCVPAFRAIKETSPQARLTLLASSAGSVVAELCPYLDDVIVYDAPWMDVARVLPQRQQREADVVRTIQERQFDGAIIFTSYHQSSLPAALLCYMAGVPLRLAASVDFPGTLLTTRHRHSATVVHEVERVLDLVAGVGFTTARKEMELRVPEGKLAEVQMMLVKKGVDLKRPIIAIHPGSTAQSRRYPWESYAAVADMLTQRHRFQVVFTGAPHEVGLIEQVRATMRSPSFSLAGETEFAQLVAAIQLADLLITNNTGPQHVASSVRTPQVVLFALTNYPHQWGPWMVPHRQLNYPTSCAICYQFTCPTDHACLRMVKPEQVVDAVLDVLSEARCTGFEKKRPAFGMGQDTTADAVSVAGPLTRTGASP